VFLRAARPVKWAYLIIGERLEESCGNFPRRPLFPTYARHGFGAFRRVLPPCRVARSGGEAAQLPLRLG
jgi:hypothetical protein